MRKESLCSQTFGVIKTRISMIGKKERGNNEIGSNETRRRQKKNYTKKAVK